LIGEVARAGGWDTVMDGSNADDARGHRPGRRASRELGGVSPFEEAGLTKPEIRELARDLGLPNWNAPSRPCLATRFPYGMELQPQLIRMVDEAEEELESMGLREFRVRMDNPYEARIEVAEAEMSIVIEKDNRSRLVKKLRGLGLRRILLDLEGYRSGSMDETAAIGQHRIFDIAQGYGKQSGASRG
jgi:pyridinium-3,5-biscarboxylic acid mononucleotide sulfurtransferase